MPLLAVKVYPWIKIRTKLTTFRMKFLVVVVILSKVICNSKTCLSHQIQQHACTSVLLTLMLLLDTTDNNTQTIGLFVQT